MLNMDFRKWGNQKGVLIENHNPGGSVCLLSLWNSWGARTQPACASADVADDVASLSATAPKSLQYIVPSTGEGKLIRKSKDKMSKPASTGNGLKWLPSTPSKCRGHQPVGRSRLSSLQPHLLRATRGTRYLGSAPS